MKTQIDMMIDIVGKICNPNSILLSALATSSVSAYAYMSNTSLFGVSILFVLIVCGFMVVDWFLGVYASVYSENKKFQSSKITYTIIKFVTFFMWLFFVNQAKAEYIQVQWAYDTILIIQIFVLLLIGIREFVSIGENIERIWGQKPYLFTLIDSVFNSLERLFKRKLEKGVEEIQNEIEENEENQEL